MLAATVEAGLYVYGVTDARCPLPADTLGIAGTLVEPIVEGPLAAIVSRLPETKLRPQRSNLAAHHRVLRGLSERQTVLPAAFGTVAAGEEQLRTLLVCNRDAIAGLLKRLECKVEMGLKVYWDTPNIFDYFVANHRELETMRNRIFRPGRVPTLEEKVALGELFASLLRQSRQRHADRLLEALAPYCVDIRAVDPAEERMITKLACLVEKDRQQPWEDAVRQTASLFDHHYRFDYSGPWAPYSFVDIDLDLEEAT